MIPGRGCFVMLAAFFAMSGCASIPTLPVVEPAPAKFYGGVDLDSPIARIAILNVGLDHDVIIDDEVHWRIGKAIEDQLRAKGFDVVPYERSVKDWFAQGMKQGGFFDAVTGEYYRDRWEAALDAFVSEYVAEHGVDGLVLAQVSMETARYQEGEGIAYFCNTAQVLRKYEANLLDRLTMPKYVYEVQASCLTLWLADLDGNYLYGAVGGIGVHSMLSPSGVQPLPAEEVLDDEEMLRPAVHLAARELSAPFSR